MFDSTTRDSILALTAERLDAARARGHRCGAVLAGDPHWGRPLCEVILGSVKRDPVLWVSDQIPPLDRGVRSKDALTYLGAEFAAAVIDLHDGFNPDVFGAISGTVKGGGLLVLLTPGLQTWASQPDPEQGRFAVDPRQPVDITGRYLERLVRVIRADPALIRIEQGKPLDGVRTPPVEAPAVPPSTDPNCVTADQAGAVAAILRVKRGQRRRPLVLTSDRGRGKSAALGIAAARLLADNVGQILVTAPRVEAVASLFDRVRDLLPSARGGPTTLHYESSTILYCPPDQVPEHLAATDLLLVDEAAGISVPLLASFLKACPRIAFATTVHGYEGTGRGFALRFNTILDHQSRGWREYRMETPIRWSSGDPVERFTFDALLLDARPASHSVLSQKRAANFHVERLEREALAADERTLRQVFGLLVLAHYRTRPYDLRYLLDGPNLRIYVARLDGFVVATALVATEGGFDADTALAIVEGRSRPRGHLLPESLGAHLGLTRAPTLRSARIVRIAVHPIRQREGIGRRLLDGIKRDLQSEGSDLLGTSFGANAALIGFWRSAGFRAVRMSVRRGSASGAHSTLMVCPLSDAGASLIDEASRCFGRLLPWQLTDSLRQLEPDIALPLVRGRVAADADHPGISDWVDAISFAYGGRIFEMCLPGLRCLALTGLSRHGASSPLNAKESTVLLVRVLQGRGWRESAAVLDLEGRAQVLALLRVAIRRIVEWIAPDDVRRDAHALAARFQSGPGKVPRS